MSLPSYQEATTRGDPLVLISEYLTDAKDLLAACLVSKSWYIIFAPKLWADPPRILSTQSNSHLGFALLWRSAFELPKEALCLIHTLDLRVFQPPLPLKLNAWLAQVEKRLPYIKFIVLDRPSTPATSVDTVAEDEEDPEDERDEPLPRPKGLLKFRRLRSSYLSSDWVALDELSPVVLSAVNSPVLQYPMLRSLYFTRSLIYMDLSGTLKPAGLDWYRLTALPSIRVVKLRNMRITSAELILISWGLAFNAFSLDLRDNELTDDCIEVIVRYNILSKLKARSQSKVDEKEIYQGNPTRNLERYVEDAPPYFAQRDLNDSEEQRLLIEGGFGLRPDGLDDVMRILKEENTLHDIMTRGVPMATTGFMRTTGLTNLYLAGNKFTCNALIDLLRSTNRLQLIDFGGAHQNPHIPPMLAVRNPYVVAHSQPQTVQLLDWHNAQRLEWLRVHHSVVTHTATLKTTGDYRMSEMAKVRLSEHVYCPYERLRWSELIPDVNPKIKYLCLTNVPRKSLSQIAEALTRFLYYAAIQEERIAAIKPDTTSRRDVRYLTGLRVLRLEFEKSVVLHSSSSSQAGPSVSEDQDADNFLNESMRDFSFFDRPTGSPPGPEFETDFSFFSISEPYTDPKDRPKSNFLSFKDETLANMLVDVADKIRSYRKKTKAAYDKEQKRLGPGVRVPPGQPHRHWTGRLELVT